MIDENKPLQLVDKEEVGWLDANTNQEDNIIIWETIILEYLSDNNNNVGNYLVKPWGIYIYGRKMNKVKAINNEKQIMRELNFMIEKLTKKNNAFYDYEFIF